MKFFLSEKAPNLEVLAVSWINSNNNKQDPFLVAKVKNIGQSPALVSVPEIYVMDTKRNVFITLKPKPWHDFISYPSEKIIQQKEKNIIIFSFSDLQNQLKNLGLDDWFNENPKLRLKRFDEGMGRIGWPPIIIKFEVKDVFENTDAFLHELIIEE